MSHNLGGSFNIQVKRDVVNLGGYREATVAAIRERFTVNASPVQNIKVGMSQKTVGRRTSRPQTGAYEHGKRSFFG
jgi:hypothetical protein